MTSSTTTSTQPPHGVLIHTVFVLSGIAALVYQVVWQRSLLSVYGTNIESIAMVVSAFLAGLGLGSLAGGEIARRTSLPLLGIFSFLEIAVGIYGAVSLHLFQLVGAATSTLGPLATGTVCFTLLLLPTLAIGSTLPLLVTYRVGTSGDVGLSVGTLYFVNTLGASVGAFLASFVLLGRLGMQGTVWVAAGLNITAGILVLFGRLRTGQST